MILSRLGLPMDETLPESPPMKLTNWWELGAKWGGSAPAGHCECD